MGRTKDDFIKYPRTPHIFGSKGTADDKRLDQACSKEYLKHPGLVVEEKIDGTNIGVHFRQGKTVMQNRGHELGSGEHPQYDLFKAWIQAKEALLRQVLDERYIVYGEWMYALHTVSYTNLPHYFFEFDIYDKEHAYFLDTESRHKLLEGSGVVSVPILHRGPLKDEEELKSLITTSLYSDCLAEGLYLKIEERGKTVARAKYVRPEFTQAIIDSGEHWQKRKVVPNRLSPGSDIWG